MEPAARMFKLVRPSLSDQERLFSSEGNHSRVDKNYEEHLQKTTLSIWPSTTKECYDFPPGFGGPRGIPQIKWNYPSSERLFSSGGNHSKVDKNYEEHLRKRTLPIWPSTKKERDDFPPAFGGPFGIPQVKWKHPSSERLFSSGHNHSKVNKNYEECDDFPPGFGGPRGIPQIKWKCPFSFALNPAWLVRAGEESKEKDYQKQRELRVLEEIYPRDCYIPFGPRVSLDVEKEWYDDSLTPLVPLKGIEEIEEVVNDGVVNSQCSGKQLVTETCYKEGDLKAAIEFVVEIIKHKKEGNSNIDSNFILEMANDPIKMRKITEQYCDALKNTTATAPLAMPAPVQTPPPPPPPRGEKRAAPASENERTFCNKQVGSSAAGVLNYQSKDCKYFNSARGCRNGSRCRFRHNTSVWRM